MKQREYFLFKIFLFLFVNIALSYSQNDSWLSYSDRETLRSMNVEYTFPAGFIGSDSIEDLTKLPNFKGKGTQWCKLQSSDGHFVAFMEFKTNYLPPSVQYWPSEDENNRAHINFIKKDIIASMGEKNRNSGKNISNTIRQKKQKTDSTPTLPSCIQ